MKEEIEFLASFGDEDKKVQIVGMKAGGYHIYIDKYYYGLIVEYINGWTVVPQNPDIWTMDDRQAILEVLEKYWLEHENE